MHATIRAGLCLAALAVPAAIAIAQPAGDTPPPPTRMMPAPPTKAQAETRAMALFERLDTNHDGYVTRPEAEAGEARMHAAMAERMKGRHDAAFARMDTDRNGSISRAEYDAAGAGQMRMRMAMRDAPPRPPVPPMPPMPPRDGAAPPAPPAAPAPPMKGGRMGHGGKGPGMMSAMFDRIDADHDGRISRAEAKMVADMHAAPRGPRPGDGKTSS